MVTPSIMLSPRSMQLTPAGLSDLGTFKAPTFPDFLSGVSRSKTDYRYPRLTEKSLSKTDFLGDQEQQRGPTHMKIRQTPVGFSFKHRLRRFFSRSGRSIAYIILTLPRRGPFLRSHHLSWIHRSRRREQKRHFDQ